MLMTLPTYDVWMGRTLQEKPPIATLLKRAEKGVKSAPIVFGHAFSPTGTLFVGSRLSAWRLLYRYAFQHDPRSTSTATLKREPTCGRVTLLYMRYAHAFKRSYKELLPRFNERSYDELWPRFNERSYEELWPRFNERSYEELWSRFK
ncbi:hypothetical protein PIB30_086043, partial [Stylosanthes scabra]|nr:hypothetical protein [Stylosanthes scabra]